MNYVVIHGANRYAAFKMTIPRNGGTPSDPACLTRLSGHIEAGGFSNKQEDVTLRTSTVNLLAGAIALAAAAVGLAQAIKDSTSSPAPAPTEVSRDSAVETHGDNSPAIVGNNNVVNSVARP